ncbi:hypothetical protein OHS58_03835 [Amycolatopsis sp. NBC_00348]|uniref:hypothetical protein n=1 Tax=Amycolatopsis sp. NBC_00348 TaxID=2975956 RepID=UPI002E271427
MTTTRPAPAVSSARLRTTVTALAEDRFTGRRVGTTGGRTAAAWLAEQLRAIGATVTTDAFPVPRVRELYRTPHLTWDGRALVHRRDFVEHLASADLPAPATGELVRADADELGGLWVLAPDLGVSARASREGAVGLLVPRGTDEAGWMPKMIAGPPPGNLPVLAIRTELHRQLPTRRRSPRRSRCARSTSPARTCTACCANLPRRG